MKGLRTVEMDLGGYFQYFKGVYKKDKGSHFFAGLVEIGQGVMVLK